MIIEPIAHYYSYFPTKFGIPRQSGIVNELCGRIVFTSKYRNADALRGLEGFDYIWLIWEFSANKNDNKVWHPTVRPPLLGGNKAMGVFATRSPFRPNAIGLSSVKIERIEYEGAEAPFIYVCGADLMNGTPIFDIKPYLKYVDSHPNAKSGFVDENSWQTLNVYIPDDIGCRLDKDLKNMLVRVLEMDPRPQYHNDPDKIYGMPFDVYDVRFRVEEDTLYVIDIIDVSK